MISLRPSKRDELELFDGMDRQDHANIFVNQTGLKTHKKYYSDPNITYLSIENSSGEFCGYFILVCCMPRIESYPLELIHAECNALMLKP